MNKPTHETPSARPFAIPQNSRWTVAHQRVTFKSSADRSSVRVYASKVKDAGKNGNLVKIRSGSNAPARASLTNAAVNAAIEWALGARLSRVVYLCERPDGLIQVSLDSDPKFPSVTVDGNDASALRDALERLSQEATYRRDATATQVPADPAHLQCLLTVHGTARD
ncbi:MAG: hypothetical protein ACXV3C_14660 [Actinomycetes bacterium]